MAISDVLNSWFSSLKKAAFKYRDGFFELPLVSNSPETIIESLARMPFVYNDTKKEIFGTKNPFVNSTVPYQKIEEGLWVFYSKAYYKENINFLRSKEKDIEGDYSKLYLEINSNKTSSKNVLLNGIAYSNSNWILHKPFDSSTYCKFKGCETATLVLHFTNAWHNNVLSKKQFYRESHLADFFNSKAEFVSMSYELEEAKKLEANTKALFDKKALGNDTKEDWQFWALEFFKRFTERFSEQDVHAKMYDFAHTDRVKLSKAEKILMDRLYEDFVGIDYLANEVGISPTKLKRNFKLVYGASIFQYFRSVQMTHAKKVLEKNKEHKIQEIALMFGYNNMTKFANAFKTVHDVFPSEMRQTHSLVDG